MALTAQDVVGSLLRWRETVKGQLARILDAAIAAKDDAVNVAARIRGYAAPLLAPRRTIAGALRRPQASALVDSYPARPGMASAGTRRLMVIATGEAHRDAVIATAGDGGFGVLWMLAPEHDHTDTCDGYATRDNGFGVGVFYPPDTTPNRPHLRCIPAGAMVSGPELRGSTQRWYDGELVEIVTAKGKHLAVTPNHPILTPDGWVAAAFLQEGDDVVCGGFCHGEVSAIDPNDNHVPALIEDVAVTLRGAASVKSMRVPTASGDFHGDGANSEVCVVRTNRLLHDTLDAAVTQPDGHHLLIGRDMGLQALSGDGGAAPSIERVGFAPLGSMSGLRVRDAYLLGDRRSMERGRLGDRAYVDACFHQTTMDGDSANAVRTSQRLLGLPGHVSGDDLSVRDGLPAESLQLGALDLFDRLRRAQDPAIDQLLSQVVSGDVEVGGDIRVTQSIDVHVDRIVDARAKPFAGHVYNLETSEGWYIANDIITHNCACIQALIPLSTGRRVA